MEKPRWVKNWKNLKNRRKKLKIKTWWLILALAPLFVIDVNLLRADHIRMTELRDAVMTADAEDDDEGIAASLAELKEFVFSNIVINVVEENGLQRVSFGTGPFYLEHQYLRAAHQALEEAEKALKSDENPNGNVYAAASDACRGQAIVNGWAWNDAGYINCMMSEIQKYPAADELQDTIIANLPSTELYRHNYASPVWAPTLAGAMILITLVIILVILVRAIIWIILRISLLFL